MDQGATGWVGPKDARVWVVDPAAELVRLNYKPTARVYDGDCDHDRKVRRDYGNGTSYCPACDASRGADNEWRVLSG